MNLIKSLFVLFYRRLQLRKVRWYSIDRLMAATIFIFMFSSIFLLFFYSILVFHINYCCSRSSDIIVTLTSTSRRFQYELPITLHSLLTQTQLPKEIRIYLTSINIIHTKTSTLKHLKYLLKRIDSSIILEKLFDKLVQIRFEKEDYGPATKFLPILQEFHQLTTNKSKSQAIMICDDDHYYHPHTISTLIKYSNQYKNYIVGLRGWRIREDLIWGVSNHEEIAYHIIESFHLSEIYRVGIVTANHAYVIRPSFFDFHIYLDFKQAPVDVRRVDDIWLNGYASKKNISRFVIPGCCSSISVTRTHELENFLIAHQMTRSSANDHALKWFNQSWEKDLWYRFNGKNRPKYLHWWRKIYRKWISIILRLKLIIYVGFV